MEVTQQAASKAVVELEGFGYVERAADPEDGRVRRVRLTRKGRAAVEAGRAARKKLGARLASEVGAARLEAATTTLARVLELFSTASAVRARRVRAPE
jgi:DNA-binding MarR family transcriptional regulator